MEGNKKPLMGVVVNCMNLNIRKDPTQASRSLGIIGSDTVVKVCNDESVSGFYKVKTDDHADHVYLLVNPLHFLKL